MLKEQFRHDIFNYLFGHSKKELYSNDFDSRYFPKGWNQLYRKCGDVADGVVVDFPIHIWKKIQWTKTTDYYVDDNKTVPKKKTLREIIKLEILKINSSTKFNEQSHIKSYIT